MRSALLSVLLISCSLGPPPEITPPSALACDAPRGILGTWTHGTTTMEMRPDGSVLRDGRDGSLRWVMPGQAMLDFAGSHELHTLGLSGPTQLLDVDERGARVWTRASLLPNYPAGCFDLRGSVVGDWSDAMQTESFERDGTFVRGDVRGNWTLSDQGFLDIGIAARVIRYRAALAAPDLLVTVREGSPDPDDPRPLASVETRLY